MDRVINQAAQLAAVIKAARKESGVDQAELAAILGLTQGRFSQLEADMSKLTVDRLFTVMRRLGLELVVRQQDADAGPPDRSTQTTPSAKAVAVHKGEASQAIKPVIGMVMNRAPRLGDFSVGRLGAPKPGKRSDDRNRG
ncbi:MAG TPA: XRE family transcriptional regulator [Aquabacterium sp.]|uniref:XRE family transcriptional regulator n=1 Tax=Aquabacterium sp. TaxID=1872578 RepID=UPI002E2EADCF|nr:XRE family transcriptional regulator [Aquabacterium sp.]HEX5374454.1 XRE family transcriptional regulator [Aquabacterium sp.]